MAVVKRLVVWFSESICEAIMTGALLLMIAHIQFRGENLRAGGYIHDVLAMSLAVAMMFVSTGYLVTTMIGRILLNPDRRWVYPAIASALFLVHFEILSFSIGGAFEPPERWVIRIVGACIVFATAFGGNQVLSFWKHSSHLTMSA